MRKFKVFLILVVFVLMLIPINTYAANQVIDANEMEAFQKTKKEIQEKWSQSELNIPNGYSIYEEEPSLVSPYSGGIVKQEYLNKVQANLNYYRYLIGSPEITQTPKNCEDLQAATVLQTLSIRSGNGLTHTLYNVFEKPDDMTEDFYKLGAYADHNIISSYNYRTPVYPFFSESIFTSTSGHRTMLLAPTTYNVDWGLGNTVYGRIFSSSSNYNLMSNAIAAYPSPGYFPKQDFIGKSDWDIYLNANNFKSLTSADAANVVVTVKSVEKNETYTYTVAKGNLYIGGRTIHIDQPEKDDYYDGDYEVYVTNLKNLNGENVDLKYTVKFFDKFEGIESTISSVTYGNSSGPIYMDGDYSEELVKMIIPKDLTIKLETGSVINLKASSYNITEGTESIYSYKYDCSPIIQNLPVWAKDTNNLLGTGMSLYVSRRENSYDFEYTQDTYEAKEGEELKISATYSGAYDEYSNYKWYKVKDAKVEELQNGTKYQIDGTNLTITNFTEDDEADYYVVNTTNVYYLAKSPIYISKALKASLEPDYIRGDINNDRVVDILDLNYGLRKLVDRDISQEEIERGDITDDEVYDILDVNKLLRYLAREIVEL